MVDHEPVLETVSRNTPLNANINQKAHFLMVKSYLKDACVEACLHMCVTKQNDFCTST